MEEGEGRGGRRETKQASGGKASWKTRQAVGGRRESEEEERE